MEEEELMEQCIEAMLEDEAEAQQEETKTFVVEAGEYVPRMLDFKVSRDLIK